MGSSGIKASFVTGGGEMGNLIASYDWSATSLGDISQWPQSLCTTLSIILHSKFPMFLYWGPDLICFYNDAYRPSLGNNGKHPKALGAKAIDVWPEIWDVINPLIKQVLNGGEATWSEDQLIPIYRNGNIENVYWTFSYSSVNDETGKPVGVFVTCNETTQKVITLKKMEETRDLYSFSIDAAELATWDLNPFTYKFTGNDRLKEWFGLKPEDEIDLTNAVNNISENYRQKVADAIEFAMQPASGGNYDIKYVIVHPNTLKERMVHAKGRAFFNEEGKAYRFNGTLQDITNENAAKEIQQELYTLVENSVDLMSILKMDGTNSYINQAGKKILGIDENADVTKIPYTDYHTPKQAAFVKNTILPSVMTDGRWSGVFSIKHSKTGEIVPLYNNCHIIRDIHTGEPMGIGAVMRDMRQELLAKKELSENEERLNIAIDATELGMWELHPVSNQLIYSKNYLLLLGFGEDEKPTREEFLNCIHPEDLPKRNSAIKNAFINGTLDFELRVVHPNKNIRWIKVKGQVFYDEQKQPQKLLGTIMDITAQKNAALDLEQKVEQRTKELQQANQQLKKVNQELESFAYVASHDLQEPLRKIQTFTSRIQQVDSERLSERGKEYFERMSYSAVRMQTLINDLLAFSRIGTTESALVKTNLNELLQKITTDLHEDLQKKEAVLSIGKLPELKVIPYQFHQLFTNLISNSLKFCRENITPIITINAAIINGDLINTEESPEQNTSYYHITFSDNGIGFLPEYAERIFEVFQRLHSKSVYEGTGIGLAICKKIVENHGGTITATGNLGLGATFNIYLPL